MSDGVYPWRVSCPVCGARVTVRPRAIQTWSQDLKLITLTAEFLGAHTCSKDAT